MVVDHIHQHLDPGLVQALDHQAEFKEAVLAGIARLGAKEADGVVTPMVAQAAFDQKAFVLKGLHRQEFNGGDAKGGVMVQHRIRRHAQIGAPHCARHLHVALGQRLDMRLVDHRAGNGMPGRHIAPPVVQGIDHDAFRHGKGAVAAVETQVAARRADAVAHQRIGPAQAAFQRPSIGVDQQFVGVEAVALFRRIGAVGAEPVQITGGQPGHMHVPDVALAFGKVEALHFLAAIVGKQAQLDPAGVAGKHGEIDAIAVPAGAERIGQTGGDPAPLRHRSPSYRAA